MALRRFSAGSPVGNLLHANPRLVCVAAQLHRVLLAGVHGECCLVAADGLLKVLAESTCLQAVPCDAEIILHLSPVRR